MGKGRILNESRTLENLPLEELELVDAACDSVNQSWLKGEPTRIEEIVLGAPESLRRVMLMELVRTEVELRLASGEQPDPAEYTNRFPQWNNELKTCIDQSLTVPLMGMDPNCMKAIGSRFEVLGLLGRGGMGVVVRARDLKLDREVAVKLLAPELTRDRLAKQRFLREARLAASVRHDNIVTIYSADEINAVALIEMELVEGESLAKRIQRLGALATAEVVDISIQIARGLGAAHAREMIHRDIKPANILIEDLGRNQSMRVKITDFGLARVSSDASITRTGIVIGTPQFISPEQADALPLDHRTDLFSLGSVMYSMCTGQTAFQAASVISILRLVADRDPTPIQQLNPQAPAWLVKIIEKLMAKKPADRFQSAGELIEALTNKGFKEPGVNAAKPRLHPGWAITAGAILVCGLLVLPSLFRKKADNNHTDGNDRPLTRQSLGEEHSTARQHPLLSDDYVWETPVNLGPGINSLDNEENACLSSDGLNMIFNRIASDGLALYESRRINVNEKFGTALPLQTEFNQQSADGPFLSFDGLALYFGLVHSNDSRNRDLWVSKRNSLKDSWGPAVSLGPNVNTTGYEQSPWVSRNGLTLIFSRSISGKFKLFEATRAHEDEDFGEAQELANVNEGDCSSFPRLTDDGRLLLFVHSAKESQKVGLWVAMRDSVKGVFGYPTELGPVVNAPQVTSGPSLSSDERTIYYSKRRSADSAYDFDLWSVTRVRK